MARVDCMVFLNGAHYVFRISCFSVLLVSGGGEEVFEV